MKTGIKRRFNLYAAVMFLITGLYIGFIWAHSMMTADVSSNESSYVLEQLTNFLKSIGTSARLTDHIVRKSAHFCEFALLGCLSLWCSWLINKNIAKNLMPAGFVCLFTAVIDEYIQMFSEGRSCEVKDVLLDFTGSVCGAAFFVVVLLIIMLIKRKKRKK